jgi:uncharacterized membrane protein YbaN (DUF454 family)
VKTQYSNETPDKAGSRAARTTQFAAMMIAWRKRNGLTRQNAARILRCTVWTVRQWERRRALPQGVSHRTIVAFLSVAVSRYGSRHFAVYVNGELLAVTVYRKGAEAVAARLREMDGRLLRVAEEGGAR